ncbi:hypothetical protein HMPREF0298_1948 [Corynebacterium lipophiloflavum DSM 44291]|uniref:Uncharacterized protein n=1 Tax=Corynebacterium lipophiloflavum (strain ATCC 700352 / DSM 44291 / CCUG 37336 / JCM 10383 / DMMZ 1944) TaxID=525263 RepID=C0XU28_CORLD|nr:hypothetical protein HMPREF0298_1948 [Corynebacterium lipophiloflavum DSM 44291]
MTYNNTKIKIFPGGWVADLGPQSNPTHRVIVRASGFAQTEARLLQYPRLGEIVGKNEFSVGTPSWIVFAWAEGCISQ